MKKTGLFFGSFNPIHLGHLIIADRIGESAGLDRVEFIVSPQNPFKQLSDLAPADMRLQWVKKGVEDHPGLSASDIEFTLPHPSYTHQTLEALKESGNQEEYHLIMGADTFISLPKWKNAGDFIYDYPIEIYRRPGTELQPSDLFSNARIHDLPLMDISATRIRKKCRERKSIRYWVPAAIRTDVEAYYSSL